MLAGFRVRMVPVSMILLAFSSLSACRRESAEKTGQTEVKVRTDAEIQRIAQAAKQSIDGLKAPLSGLQTKIAALHQQFDPLPPDLPGFGETRGKFYSTSIGLGTMSTKIPWLLGRIDSAVKSKDAAELEAIEKDIARMQEEIRQVEKITLELLHQVLPFKKMAEELDAREKSACE